VIYYEGRRKKKKDRGKLISLRVVNEEVVPRKKRDYSH